MRDLTDCEQQLRNQVKRIALQLEEPPIADENGNELPDDAIECHGNPHDYVYVSGYIRKVPSEEFEDQTHKGGIYTYDEDEDAWTCTATGQTWEGDTIGYWWSVEDDLILGGEEQTDCGPMSAYNYLSDVLDIEYRVGSDREYRSAEVLVAFGGPNIWIDTKNNTVNGAWASDRFSWSYQDNIGLEDALEEIFGATS